MKNNEATVFIFIASIIIGILITVNFNFNRSSLTMFLSAKQYQDDYNYRNILVSEVGALRNKYLDLLNQTAQFEKSSKSDSDIEAEINKELYNARIVAGVTDVEGPGIIINLDDGTNVLGKTQVNTNNDISKLIHYSDVLQVVDDLRYAGAEAISINGERVVNTTEIYCSSAFLQINGTEVPSPYTILAIGNKDKLKEYESSNHNILFTLSKIRGISVKISTRNDIVIKKLSKTINENYINQK